MGFFSVNIFNRKKLLVDTDAGAVAQSFEKLKKSSIPCEMHTKRLRSTVGMRIDVSAYMQYNQAYVGNPQHYGYTYTIYVPRKYLQKAKSILHI
ncbi:MAG: hypothetical protein J6P94_02230 [Oscillospiraceae bacterium]|nr:hypothetical protein [Oscillospiraceae bacterium]